MGTDPMPKRWNPVELDGVKPPFRHDILWSEGGRWWSFPAFFTSKVNSFYVKGQYPYAKGQYPYAKGQYRKHPCFKRVFPKLK